MYQVTKEDIITICRHIVMTYPYSQCNRINTFAVVDNQDDLETNNLGATYQDYLDGFFWSRTWVNQGASENNMCKEYPLLIVEQKGSTRNSLFDIEFCREFYIVIADVPDCTDCPTECARSEKQVMLDVESMVETVIRQLRTYNLYEVTYPDTTTANLWTSLGQVQHWLSEASITQYRKLIDLEGFIRSGQINIFPTELGISDGAVAVAFNFSICSCEAVSTEFEYANSTPTEYAQANCKLC